MGLYLHEAYAFCPRCGAAFASREQAVLKCGACDLSMYLSPLPASGLILRDKEGRICFSRRDIEPRKGTLDLVGGFISPDETLEEGTLREMHEETGIALSIDRLLYRGSTPTDYLYKELIFKVLGFFFEVTLSDEEIATLRPQDDISSLEWHHLSDLTSEQVAFPEVFAFLTQT